MPALPFALFALVLAASCADDSNSPGGGVSLDDRDASGPSEGGGSSREGGASSEAGASGGASSLDSGSREADADAGNGPWYTQVQGFAAVAGVTGGLGGRNLVVTSLASKGPGTLREAMADRDGARTITFTPGLSGTLTLETEVAYLNSGDVTIDGAGADIKIAGFTLAVFTVQGQPIRNVILHDLTFENTEPERSAVIVDHGSHDVWIDHCTFRNNSVGNGGQGLSLRNQDMGRGGNTGVTLSWNHFTTPNKKSILISSGDTETEGRAMRISIHHNWFDGVSARNPRISFATVHMWNNYVSNWREYGVAAALETNLLAENNVLEANNKNGILSDYADTLASSVAASGNLSIGEPLPLVSTRGTFPSERVSYAITPEVADAALKARVMGSAGAHGAP